MPERLEESYRWCKRLCRHSGSSFCWSFGLLDREAALGMYALYAFARISDDLADDAGSPAHKRFCLEAWRQRVAWLDAARDGASKWLESELPIELTQFDSLWPALQDTVTKFGIPLNLLDEIVLGVSMDIEHQQPQDWSELEHYCYHVASAVGLACTHIWRADRTMPRQVAVDCGIAFQLTNILRDIASDARQGRIYLPLSEFERFGVSPDAWLQLKPGGDWVGMVAAVSARAEALYRSGWQTQQFLPAASQRVFSLMWRYYRELLNQVCRRRAQLWDSKRLKVSPVARARLAAQHFISPLYRALPSPTCYSTPRLRKGLKRT